MTTACTLLAQGGGRGSDFTDDRNKNLGEEKPIGEARIGMYHAKLQRKRDVPCQCLIA